MIPNRHPMIAIVDYGLGNLFSIARACELAGLETRVTGDAADLKSADAVLLPGVGAFGDAMASLRERRLDSALKDVAASGKPLVGVCLGLQLLMTESHEFGTHKGLDLVPGTVRRLHPADGAKVPQVGWNSIRAPGGKSWRGSALAGIADGTYMYFVHSYFVEPADSSVVLARTAYGGSEFCASIQQGNIFACQFHPERSGADGLAVYRNVARLVAEGELT